MSEEAIAATQYGDIKGTISIDGFDSLSVNDLYTKASVPKGYRPIGLRISGSRRDKNGDLRINARVLCVDTEQTGSSPADIRRFGQDQKELHVFEFDAEIDFEDMVRSVKRYDIVLTSKIVRGIDIKIQHNDD